MDVQFLLSAATIVAIYYLLAAAMNLQYGIAGVLNLGLHGVFAVGAYSYGMLTSAPGSPTAFAFGLAWPTAAVIAIVSGAVISAALVAPALLIDSRIRGPYLLPMITLAAAETLIVLLSSNNAIAGGFAGMFGVPQPLTSVASEIGADGFAWFYLGLVLTACVAVTWLISALRNSPFGLLARAVRDDELEVRSLGFTPVRYQLAAVAIGGGIMGLAGVLWAGYLTTLQPSGFTIFETLLVLIAVIAGGRGSVRGAVVGSLVIFGFLNQMTRLLPSEVLSTVPGTRQIVLGIILILLLRYRPNGIVPDRPRSYRKTLSQLNDRRTTPVTASAGA